MKGTWYLPLAIGLLLSIGSCVDKQASQIDGAYRAIKMMEGAIGVGVSYARYGELLQDASGELLIAQQRATSASERAAVARYSRALSHYNDAYVLWTEKVDDAKYSFIPEGKILVSGKVATVVKQQWLQTEERRIATSTFSFVSEDALQLLWSRAGQETARADSLYLTLR